MLVWGRWRVFAKMVRNMGRAVPHVYLLALRAVYLWNAYVLSVGNMG